MNPADPRVERMRDYADARLEELESGQTLLVLFAADRPLLALAAGLPRALDRERLLTVARYLMRRESADGYWLIVPMVQDGAPCLLLEWGAVSDRGHSVLSLSEASGQIQLGEAQNLTGAEPLLGDLFATGGGLPGRLRRQLDRLAEASAVPLPALDCSPEAPRAALNQCR